MPMDQRLKVTQATCAQPLRLACRLAESVPAVQGLQRPGNCCGCLRQARASNGLDYTSPMKPVPGTPRRHFSMIRDMHLADAFTLANAACGVAAVFCALVYVESGSREYFAAAAAMAPAAFILDVLDGRVA